MILTSGRIIPNWILQLAFIEFDEVTTMADVIKDIEDIMQDELNVTDHSKLSTKDALEIFGKFNVILPDYESMLCEFFEKHDLGPDEYDGDDDDDNDEPSGPEDPEDNTVDEKPVTPTEVKYKEAVLVK